MLFGEHAVLHGSGCIVTAVNQRMRATVELLNEPIFQLNAPDVNITNYKKPWSEIGKGDIPKGAKFVEVAVKNFLCHPELVSGSHLSLEMLKRVQHDRIGLFVQTQSEFSSLFGFGSSSAVTVCVLKALSVLFDIKLSNKELFNLSYKTVLDIQGKGSGFDIAAAIFGGTLYFTNGGKVTKPLNVKHLPLVIGYSGIKADTVTVINQVEEKTKKDPDVVKNIYNHIAKIVEEAKVALVSDNWEACGKHMNKNQEFLQQLGVSTKKLDNMIMAASDAGAYGAKLSGAGGGDCIVALVSKNKRQVVLESIKKVGGTVIDVEVNAEGVRVEL